MNVIKETAPAKINLFLDVTAKRDDGFHEIRSVMHSVSLSDEITVKRLSGEGGTVRLLLDGNRRLPTDGKNLAVRAARAFLDAAAISDSIEIRLKKRIPVAAGLGGGSADAAAVLRALNRLYKKPFTEKMLLSIAASLGSDVPYCLIGGTAICLGRGEIMTRTAPPKPFFAVIASSGERVSTPVAYAELDSLFSDFSAGGDTLAEKKYRELLDSISEGRRLPDLYNVFESVILPRCEGAARLRVRLAELGATCTLMSGSGPSIFGVFDSEEAAYAARDVLRTEGILAFFAKG